LIYIFFWILFIIIFLRFNLSGGFMKYFIISLMIFISLLMGACQKQEAKQADKESKLAKLWETPKVMLTSESVLFDEDRNIIYVSNINGQPLEKNEQGFISKLSPEGEVLVEKWIEGLNAPKGMGVFEDKLYVTDIDQVVEIDIAKGEIASRYPAQGSKFLNDISIDKSGNIYISDMTANKIYRISKGSIDVWLESELLNNPNGLFVENGSLLIGITDSVLKADLQTKELTVYIQNTGGIDGIVPDGKGNYLISDWEGHIHLISPNKEKVKLLDTTTENINAADIDYVISKKMLLVPTFFDNRVMAYKLEN
jgi:sugar lactone lactonase YvrE